MKILLTHVYTAKNKGDAGIVAGMLSELRRLRPDSDITIVAMQEPKANPYRREGTKMITSFFYEAIYRNHNPVIRVLRTVGIMIVTILKWDWITPKKVRMTMAAYRAADLVMPVGGGYLRAKNTIQGWVTLILQLHAILIARIMGKPVYMYSQSVGPLPSKAMQYMVKAVLNTVQLIYVREPITERLLLKMGVKRELIRTGADAGFLLASVGPRLTPSEAVGISVRNWLGKLPQARYEKAIAATVDFIIEKHKRPVIFVPQVTASDQNDDDRTTAERIYREIRNRDQITIIREDMNLTQIKNIYDTLNLFIGTRMHANIFSLTSYVPVIAIEYEHKTRGIMRELGLERWVISIEQVTYDKLKKMFDKLVREQHKYRDYLKATLPAYVEKARDPMRKILEHYADST